MLVKLAPPLIAAFAVFTVRACAANELPGQIAGIVEYTLEKTWSEERNRLGEKKTSYHSDSDIAFEWKYQVSEWEDAWTRASADGVEYKKYPANIYVGDMTGDTCYYLLLDAYGYEFGEEDTEYGENWTADVSMSSTFLFWTGSGQKDKIAAELIQMLERKYRVSDKNLLRNDAVAINTTELTLDDKTEIHLSFPDPMRISLHIEHIPAVETDISNPELSVGELIGYLASSWSTEQHFDTAACQCLELQGYVFLTGDGYSAVVDDGRVPFSSGTIGKEAEIGLESLSYEEMEEALTEYFGPVWDESESGKRFSADGERFLELSRITENKNGTVYKIHYID